MARITIAGDAVVIKSQLTLNAIKEIEKYKPKALVLREADENGRFEEVFRVATGDKPSVSKFGITFASESHDGTGTATLTESVPADVQDIMGYVADKYGVAIMKLNEWEESSDVIINCIQMEKENVLANITMA